MALRKIITKPLPAPPAQNQASLVDQVLAAPQMTAVRMFWNSFRDLQPWWPVIIPILLWVGVRTYQKERAVLRRETA